MLPFKSGISVAGTITAQRNDTALNSETLSGQKILVRDCEQWQAFSAASPQSCILPNATLLPVGWSVVVESSGAEAITVKTSHPTTPVDLKEVLPGRAFRFTCTSIASQAGIWNTDPVGQAYSSVWGDITGTLSNQTDLQNALNAKAAGDHTHAGVYDTVGTAAGLFASHMGTADPHPQYLDLAEGQAAFYPALPGEPNGFENRDDVTFAWDNSTRTLTLTGSFAIWSDGIRYAKTGPLSIIIGATEGSHYIYFDGNGVLQTSNVFLSDVIDKYCYVMSVYWDATNNQAIPWPINETHGFQMPSTVHRYLHTTQGTQYISGIALTLNATGNGSANSHCQFTSSEGRIVDEDIPHTIIARTTLADNMRVLYRSGATGAWRMGAASPFPVLTTGSGRAAWNQYTGGVWSLAEATNGNYVLAHIYALPSIDNQAGELAVVMGQAQYNTVSSARTSAYTEASILQLTGLPTAEFKLIATVIVQTNNTYANTVKSRFVQTDTGGDYIDWRTATPVSTSSTSGSSWGAITGTLSTQADLQAALNGIIASMTTTQRDGLSVPLAGKVIFNTTTSKHQGYDGSVWNDFY